LLPRGERRRYHHTGLIFKASKRETREPVPAPALVRTHRKEVESHLALAVHAQRLRQQRQRRHQHQCACRGELLVDEQCRQSEKGCLSPDFFAQ
jgi:hypothetical protein